jgi:large subunit ribosomal protein L9
MEIILLKDVENLGFTDDIVTVKNGYGRNYLIPQGFAILATPSAKKVLAEKLKQRAFKEKHIVEEAQKVAEKLRALEVKIPAKVGAGDKLFGSVNNQNIAEFLQKEGFDIEKKYISVIGGSVKRIGKYDSKVRLHREVVVDLEFEVTPIRDEKSIAEAKAKAAAEAAEKAKAEAEKTEKADSVENTDNQETETTE